MVVDIVELPRRFSQFKYDDASINSEMVYGFPISCISREYGYWHPDDESYMSVGGKHRLILGSDALFRYKFIEPTRYGIAEYFVLTASPIDIRRPFRNKRTRLYCPWVTITDPKTLKFRKFVLWSGIFELMHYETEDSVHDVPIDAVIFNEIENFAKLHNRRDILDGLEGYQHNWENTLVSEENLDSDTAVNILTELGANIKAYNEVTVDQEPYYWPDAYDIFRGINLPYKWSDLTPLRSCSLITHVLHGSTTIGDIKHLFGMQYDTHAFQRMFNLMDMDPYTELSVDGCSPDIFGLFKNVEHLPYSEFSLVFDNDGSFNMKVFNQYDPYMHIDPKIISIDQDVKVNITNLVKRIFPNARGEIVRSWGEEIYITFKYTNGEVVRYYFDLISASIGSRSLIRDYAGNIFC